MVINYNLIIHNTLLSQQHTHRVVVNVKDVDKKKFGGPGRKKKACKYKKCSGITKQTNNTIQEAIDKLSSFADQYRKHRII